LTLVVDASVAIKWVVEEPGAELAVQVLGRALVAPDLFQVEVGHVLTREVRGKRLAASQARGGFEFILSHVELISTRRFATSSFELSLELGHSIHDCFYYVSAEATDVPLVTADAVFARKLRESGRGAVVYLLGEELPDV
jgi:predicted nucleic acid-binding protein